MPLHSGLLLGPALTSSSDPANLMPSSFPQRRSSLCPECFSSSPAGSCPHSPPWAGGSNRCSSTSTKEKFLELTHYKEWFASFVPGGTVVLYLIFQDNTWVLLSRAVLLSVGSQPELMHGVIPAWYSALHGSAKLSEVSRGLKFPRVPLIKALVFSMPTTPPSLVVLQNSRGSLLPLA